MRRHIHFRASHKRFTMKSYTKNVFICLTTTLLLVSASFSLTGCQAKTNTQTTAPITENTLTASEATSEATSDASANTPEVSTSCITKDDMIYFLMVDRFADSNPDDNLPDVDKNNPKAFQGGDLQGIINQLDYIKSLGTNALWITPIMENGPNGYHGYWIYDFYKVDPHFGDLETFKTLVAEAHKCDIKVVLDYIVNHTGYDSPWLKDPEKQDWFHENKTINNWKDKTEVEMGWLAGLPDLDQSNPEVEAYFIDNALWWIEETGIDGFRLDTVRHVSHDFWKTFSSTIKAKYPDFFLLGEVWDQNAKTLEAYHQDGIDSITNYSLFNGIENAFKLQTMPASLVNALKKESEFSHPSQNALFIDNHDNSRFMSNNPRMSEEYTKEALTFLYTYPAIPVLYYGTEIGMKGAYDPDNRQMMAWENTENSALLDYVKTLKDIRDQYMDTFTLVASGSDFIAYEIKKDDQKMLIVMNTSDKETTVTFDYAAKSLTDYTTSTAVDAYNGQSVSLKFAPVSIGFYVVK